MKKYTLSDRIIVDSRESHFLFKQNFCGFFPLAEEVLRCVNRNRCRNAWKLTRRDEFHALIAFFTVCTARSASPLHLGLWIGLSNLVQTCACNHVTILSLINSFALSETKVCETPNLPQMAGKQCMTFSVGRSPHMNASIQPEPASTIITMLHTSWI